MHIRYELEEYHIRNGAHKVSRTIALYNLYYRDARTYNVSHKTLADIIYRIIYSHLHRTEKLREMVVLYEKIRLM